MKKEITGMCVIIDGGGSPPQPYTGAIAGDPLITEDSITFVTESGDTLTTE